MEAILLMGIQATGKSSFYRERFSASHLPISLDMLRTRHRESRLLEVCLDTQQPFVVDNTNPQRADRERYISRAKAAGMKVIGYYFSSSIEGALSRNEKREGRARVPDAGVKGTHARLELPSFEEGFDELYYVKPSGDGFDIQEWTDEV